MFAKPRCVRKRRSSSSGLTPGSSRRNTLRISSSSKTIDVFDCSLAISARGRQLRAETGEALERAELEHALAGLHVRAGADHVHELAHVARIGERVEVVARS